MLIGENSLAYFASLPTLKSFINVEQGFSTLQWCQTPSLSCKYWTRIKMFSQGNPLAYFASLTCHYDIRVKILARKNTLAYFIRVPMTKNVL
jgi:hypothetical protein